VKIIDIEPIGNADRVCIDLVNILNEGDGIFVGSSSKSMLLMHSETIESEFVPTRPFRVNAGAVHAYTLLADNSTKYLSELNPGDKILVSNVEGDTYSSTIGRVKIEPRPMLIIKWRDENDNEAQSFVQQAETVRVVNNLGEPKSVTTLQRGEYLLARIESRGRHIGKEIQTIVDER
jgi:3-dehydroquinate synthase II